MLENAVRDDLLAELERLNLAGSLTSDADTNAAWLNIFGEVLSVHCPRLERLDLSDNNLGVPGASALSRICNNLTCGKSSDCGYRSTHIHFNRTNFGDKSLFVLIKSLKFVSTLQMEGNDIHSTGVLCLADAVCTRKIVIKFELDLNDNPLRAEGTIAVGKILSSNHCLFQLVRLSRCELTTIGGSAPNDDFLNLDNTTASEVVRNVGRQLYQMPQNG